MQRASTEVCRHECLQGSNCVISEETASHDRLILTPASLLSLAPSSCHGMPIRFVPPIGHLLFLALACRLRLHCFFYACAPQDRIVKLEDLPAAITGGFRTLGSQLANFRAMVLQVGQGWQGMMQTHYMYGIQLSTTLCCQ